MLIPNYYLITNSKLIVSNLICNLLFKFAVEAAEKAKQGVFRYGSKVMLSGDDAKKAAAAAGNTFLKRFLSIILEIQMHSRPDSAIPKGGGW